MTVNSLTCKDRLWEVAQTDAAAVARLAAAAGLSATTAGILLGRGVDSPEAVRAFLEPSLERDWIATSDISGMAEVAAAVAAAVSAGEHIVVFGDFDLDGISAAATAALGLRAMGGRVTPVVPHRFREGYGLTQAAISRVVSLAPALVITVDCGISSAVEVALLAERGIRTVVTDHHEPGDSLPVGIPVADPKLAGARGPELSGSGVALELVRAVGAILGHAQAWREITDLAMLGTVADIVPLTGPNRALVADGLALARRGTRQGLAALAEVAGISLGTLRSDDIAFGIAPRLNAAGRMADPALSLDLLLAEDADEAMTLARALDEHNRLRQAAEGDLTDAALAEAERTFDPASRVLVVAGEGWHEGVRGLVASRLASRFGVPALVFCIDGGEAQGSGRSIGEVDLYAAVSELSGMLTRFGGHTAAVGVTLPAASLDEFRGRLSAIMSALPADQFASHIAIDAEVQLDRLSRGLAAEIELLAPFGFGNPRPLIAARGVFMNGRKRVGKNEDHLKFTAYDGVASVPAIAFRCPDIGVLSETDAAVDVAFELSLDEWRGAQRVQMLARDIRVRPAAQGAGALVDDLFEHAEEIIARGDYAGIAEADSFHTKLAGVSFEGRQELLPRLAAGTPLRLEREPDNRFDANAIAVIDPFGDHLGYLNRRLAAVLAPVIDSGVEYDVEVTEVTGGAEGASLGVNVLVSKRTQGSDDDEESRRLAGERRAALAAMGPAELEVTLVQHFIGESQPHRAQTEALAHLAEGHSTLVVMATGRGKSLIFHVHAAREAIARGRASVFVYPLRALVADQAFHLEDSFAALGCAVATVTGETSPAGRDAAFAALADGSLDVVLTTPEFLDCHAPRFAASGRIGFLVVDEAHHVGLAKAGHRPAYARLGRAREALGMPVVLAVTATAPQDVATAIRESLGVTEVVLDPTVRENLRIDDGRGSADKVTRIAALAAGGDKVIVYVNSRETSVNLARQIRSKVPALLHRCAFYNGGMTRESRHAVERAFRDGEITVVVATSAFGEGVNIPDVRHVALYHLPMGEVEFNQMCGRGGRDGEPSVVHLLFGEKDARLNRLILESAAPTREDLGALYLVLRDIAADGDGSVEVANAELAERVKRRRTSATISEKGVSTGIGVFRELGLVQSEGTGAYRRLSMLPAPESKLDLASSVRYAEGRDEIEAFEIFRVRALKAPADELLDAFNRPILPARDAIE